MINWMIVIVAMAGALLNIRNKWQGFLPWLVSNAWWCGYNIRAGEYPQAFLFGIFWVLSLYGLYYWRWGLKKQAEQQEQERGYQRELDNKELSILLEENTYLRNVLNGALFHKRAKKRLRIDIPKTEQKG